MFDIRLENSKGDILEFNKSDSPFVITEVQGLSAPDATINTSANALLDGAKFNSAKVQMRSIDMIIKIIKNPEANRIILFKVLKSKQFIKFYYKGRYRDVYIEGYVESMPINYFDQIQNMTLSILCPSPYFKSAQEMINGMNSVVEMFHFPFFTAGDAPQPFSYIDTLTIINIENEGDITTGMIIQLYATQTVVNPKIFNYENGEFVGLNFTMQTGDLIEINTNKGNKKITLLRNGEYTNIFNTRMRDSVWLELAYGENIFTMEAKQGINNLRVLFKHFNQYEGV